MPLTVEKVFRFDAGHRCLGFKDKKEETLHGHTWRLRIVVEARRALGPMKTIFDTGEAFTERMVVYIASRLCRGLAAAHMLRAANGELLGLVHRDLTPGNVLIGFNGDVKITDFGLAKAKQRLTKTLTGLLKGQPAYMAPEQARGDNIDHRTDLFALGVLMFELFAGRKPWLAASDFDAVQAILMKPPDDLRDVRAKIDRELASVVQRCLQKNPAARFQSALEVQARLDEWLLVHGYQEGNEEALAWPVYLYFQATPHLAPYLSTGLFAPFHGFGDAAAVPVGIGLFWGVDASVDLIAELGFTNLAGAAPPEGSRADGRQVMVQVNVRPF